MATLTKDRAITTKGVRAMFISSFITRRRRLIYPKLVDVHDSHVETDFANAIGTVPQMEEVIDDVNNPLASDFRDYSWEWTNRLYKSKIYLSRPLLEFDQTGQSRTLLHSMAARVANFPDLLFATRLLAGSFTGGDGVSLFSASHPAPIGSSTAQSNIVTGTTPTDFCATASEATIAQQLKVDFRNVMRQFRTFKDDHNQPWHNDDIKPEDVVIVCSPLLQTPMEQAFLSKTIGATENVYYGKVKEIITSNYLTASTTSADSADWYVCIVSEMKRPFFYSRFRKIRDDEIEDYFGSQIYDEAVSGSGEITLEDLKEFASVQIETNLGHQGMNADVDVMQNERFMIAARWRGEMAGGEWRNAIQVSNAAT